MHSLCVCECECLKLIQICYVTILSKRNYNLHVTKSVLELLIMNWIQKYCYSCYSCYSILYFYTKYNKQDRIFYSLCIFTSNHKIPCVPVWLPVWLPVSVKCQGLRKNRCFETAVKMRRVWHECETFVTMLTGVWNLCDDDDSTMLWWTRNEWGGGTERQETWTLLEPIRWLPPRMSRWEDRQVRAVKVGQAGVCK